MGILNSNHAFSESNVTTHAFSKGFVLQLFNPKVAVYGLTLYSTFLAAIADHPAYLSLLAVAFALTAFVATSTWALCGAAIKTKLHNDRFPKAINAILSALLVYTAIDLSNLTTFFS